MIPSWYRRKHALSLTTSISDECSTIGNAAHATRQALTSSEGNNVASGAYEKKGDGRSTSRDTVGRDGVTD